MTRHSKLILRWKITSKRGITRNSQMDWGHNCSHVDAVPVHHGEQRAKYKSEDLNLLFALHPYPHLWS